MEVACCMSMQIPWNCNFKEPTVNPQQLINSSQGTSCSCMFRLSLAAKHHTPRQLGQRVSWSHLPASAFKLGHDMVPFTLATLNWSDAQSWSFKTDWYFMDTLKTCPRIKFIFFHGQLCLVHIILLRQEQMYGKWCSQNLTSMVSQIYWNSLSWKYQHSYISFACLT